MAKKEPLMPKNNRIAKKQKGFTLVELLIATSVFSIIMLVVTTGIIRIGQSYYKGIIQARTQEVSRSVGEDISRSIQLANGQVKKPAANIVCVGNIRYVYSLNKKVSTGVDGLVSQRLQPDDGCEDMAVGSDRKELLGDNMRLLKFDINPADSLQQTWRVSMSVAYGDDDLLSSYNDDGTPSGWDGADNNSPAVQNALCKSGIPGTSFCATSNLDILVKKRLN